jgi:hypothetical protein
MSRARRHWSGLTPALDGSGARGVRFPVACKYHPNGADRPHEDVAAMLMDSPREVRCTDKARARIEQGVGRLKRFKRVALRCEKTERNFRSIVSFAAGLCLIKFVHTA